MSYFNLILPANFRAGPYGFFLLKLVMHHAMFNSIMDDNSLVKVNPLCCGSDSSFSKTTPVLKKAIFEDIPTSQRACLEITCPGNKPLRVELDKGDVLIGRGPQCRIQLNLHDASREHARITCEEEEYRIQDLESTNGTFVNGVRVVRCVLRNNDQVQISDARILFIEERLREEI